MARIIKKPGDLLRFPLSEAGYHGYCQWLADGTARVFLAATAEGLTAVEILSLPVAFRVWIYRDTPGRYGWEKVGKAHIPEEFSQPQQYAKKDAISGALSIYFEGVETPATAAEIEGLETAAVWAHPHIVERLEALLAGRKSKAMRSVQIGV
ncbi:hypothetical protein [Pseudomonas laurentiana]